MFNRGNTAHVGPLPHSELPCSSCSLLLAHDKQTTLCQVKFASLPKTFADLGLTCREAVETCILGFLQLGSTSHPVPELFLGWGDSQSRSPCLFCPLGFTMVFPGYLITMAMNWYAGLRGVGSHCAKYPVGTFYHLSSPSP